MLKREKHICTWYADTQAYTTQMHTQIKRTLREIALDAYVRRSVFREMVGVVFLHGVPMGTGVNVHATYVHEIHQRMLHRWKIRPSRWCIFPNTNAPFRVLRSQALPHRLGVPWRGGRLTISLSIHAVLADKTKFQPIYRIDVRNGRWLTYRISLIRRRKPRTGYAYANKILMPLDRNILYPVRSSWSFNGMPSTALRDTRLASRELKK